MPGPIDSLRFVHAAILSESARIQEATAAAGSADALAALEPDVAFFEDLVLLHTHGEELGLFPVLAEKAPHIDDTYLFDHESERRLFRELRQAMSDGRIDSARHTAVLLREHASTHIEKENTLILPYVAETFSPPEQGEIVQKILSTISPEKMAVVVPWIIERIPMDMAEAYARVLSIAMPPPVFDKARGWIRSGIPADMWTELSRRVPELTA